jgi:hypothetical protein
MMSSEIDEIKRIGNEKNVGKNNEISALVVY